MEPPPRPMEPPTLSELGPRDVYFPVSPRKFVALDLLTFGIYELYWFYKNWSFVRERDDSDIWPVARAVFAPLWYPALLLDIRKHVEHGPILAGGVVAPSVLYFLLAASWRLPDPFWLVSFLTFLPLLPVVWRINSLSSEGSPLYLRNSEWRIRHLFLALFSVPLITFVAFSSLGVFPSTQVVEGARVPARDLAFMRDQGILAPGEEVLFFYSQGAFSAKEDGNLLTDRGVTSYWQDEESDAQLVEKARFAEIAEVTTEYGDWIDPTIVTISRHDGTEFLIVLSAEEDRDRLFLRRLDELIAR